MNDKSLNYTKKKKNRRTHGDLANSLIEIAIEHINETKHTEFALRDLANRLGVSHAAAYRHFKNKQALTEAIALRGFQKMNFLFEAKLKQSQTPLENLGEAYIEFATTYPGYYRVMFGSSHNTSSNEELKLTCQKSFEALSKVFGPPGKVNSEKAIYAWAVVHGLSLLLIDDQIKEPLQDFKLKLPELKKQIFRFTTKALETK